MRCKGKGIGAALQAAPILIIQVKANFNGLWLGFPGQSAVHKYHIQGIFYIKKNGNICIG
jgi:hypothetical protein